jgi:ankyrin repeat protein
LRINLSASRWATRNGSRLACGLTLLVGILSSGCGDSEKSAAGDLAEAGYSLTHEEFFRAAQTNDVEALRKFTRAGFDLNLVDARGMGALHHAAAMGMVEAAAWLLDNKAAIERPAADGRTPLMVAAHAGQAKMVAYLLRQGANPALRDSAGFKPIMLAVAAGHAPAVEALAARSREDLDAALLLAAALGRTEVVDVLTRYGASVYARMDDGRTVLMLAAENGHAATAALLVELGANRFSLGPNEQTAAQLAAAAGHQDLAAALKAAPVADDLSLPDLGGDPAHLAAMALPNTPAAAPGTVVSLDGARLAAGPDVANTLTMRGYRETPLPLAFEKVTGTRARLRLLFGDQPAVDLAAGESIPNTQLRVLRVERKFDHSKLNEGQPVDVSLVEIEDPASGTRRTLIANHEAAAHDPFAVLQELPDGRMLVARQGQQFTTSDGASWSVVDVRPTQIVIERADRSGAPITLPLAGNNPKG